MTVLRRLLPVALLGLVLGALCLVAGFGDDWVLADARPVARTDFEQAPVSDDPGSQYGNEYYRNCLRRRESGDLRCGETCFWRECVQCRNICRMHCSCDDCEDEDDEEGPGTGGGTGGGDTASAPAPSVAAAAARVVDISYAAVPAPESEVGNVCSLLPELDYPLAGAGHSVMPQSVPGTRVLPTREIPQGPPIGVAEPCDNYHDCDSNLQNQIKVNGTWLHENFGVTRNVSPGGRTLEEYLSAAGARYAAGNGKNTAAVEIPRPFALTFVVSLGGQPEEGLAFPCVVRWRRAGGGSFSGVAYDSWYGPCRVGYGAVSVQGFIAEVRPSIGGGSRREDFRRWLWRTGRYQVELVLDPGSGREYVLARRDFRIVDHSRPGRNPFPNQLDGFSGIDPGCPDCRPCGCDSRYGCGCDADSDCGCDCGGDCYCTSRCGSCTRWQWRSLGAIGSGRAPEVYGAGFNQDFMGGQAAGVGRYWYAVTPAEFSMAQDVQALVDHHYGAASRCRDVKGALTDPQVFVDDTHWGAEPVTSAEASRYSWLRAPGGRLPVLDRDTTVPTPTQDRSPASGQQAPELARRHRFAGCENAFRQQVRKSITNPAVGRSFAWVDDLFEKVRDQGEGCAQPTPWPGSAPSGWSSGRVAAWKKNVWSPRLSATRHTAECPIARTGYYPPGRLDAYPKGLVIIHWDAGQQGAGLPGEGGWDTVRLTCRGGNCTAANPGVAPGADTGGAHVMLPSDGSGCWFYDYADPERGWQTRQGHMAGAERHYAQPPRTVVAPAAVSGGGAAGSQHNDQGLTQYGTRVRERFLGFVDSRPAPHMLVEWPVRNDYVVTPAHRSALERMVASVHRNFAMGVNTDGETDLCGGVYESVWGQDHNGDAMKVRVQLCWMRYANALMLPWVVKGNETVPHTVEVVSGSHPRLPSDLRRQKFPVYRQYDSDYHANPVSRGGLTATQAATDTYNRQSCVGDRCFDLAGCPYLDHRGMLRTSFTLQRYPRPVRESEGNVRVLRLEDQHGRRFSHLLVYPSDPKAAKGTDLHVLLQDTRDPDKDARLTHDRTLKLNSHDFRVVDEADSRVLYVNMPVVGPGTYGSRSGRPVAVEEVRMPWVGYDRISGGAHDGWVRYTATDGHQATLDPALFVNCPSVCPYLDRDPAAAGRQQTYGDVGFSGWYTKQTVVGLYPECTYEPPIGAISCGSVSVERAVGIGDDFADLPFPYCPSPVISRDVDLEQCNTQVRTDRVIRTMEDYVLPPWEAGRSLTGELRAEGRTCITGVAPSFGDQTVSAPGLEVGTEIPEIVLPQATGGEGPLTYELVPSSLPPGIVRNGFTLSGTPTRAANNGYIWLVKDRDGDSHTIYFRLAVR